MKSILLTILKLVVNFLGYAVLFYVISSVFDLILGSDDPVTWSSHILESVVFGIFFTVMNTWFLKKKRIQKEETKND